MNHLPHPYFPMLLVRSSIVPGFGLASSWLQNAVFSLKQARKNGERSQEDVTRNTPCHQKSLPLPSNPFLIKKSTRFLEKINGKIELFDYNSRICTSI
jgi:hypothetical protein